MASRRYRRRAAGTEGEDDLGEREPAEQDDEPPQDTGRSATRTGGTYSLPRTDLERFLGIEGDQVTCVSIEAAQGWNEALWRRGPLPW